MHNLLQNLHCYFSDFLDLGTLVFCVGHLTDHVTGADKMEDQQPIGSLYGDDLFQNCILSGHSLAHVHQMVPFLLPFKTQKLESTILKTCIRAKIPCPSHRPLPITIKLAMFQN